MKDRKLKIPIPEPVKGLGLIVSEAGYLDGLYEYADIDGILPIRWVCNYSSLYTNDFEGKWELVPILNSGIWIDGKKYLLPTPTLGTLVVLDFNGLNQVVARPSTINFVDVWVANGDDGLDEDISSHLWNTPDHWMWISAPKGS
jgi:hypothetical protein